MTSIYFRTIKTTVYDIDIGLNLRVNNNQKMLFAFTELVVWIKAFWHA